MKIARCIVTVAPLRKEPDHRSEMVSQLLLMEDMEIVSSEKDFLKVKCLYDGYEGWVHRFQVSMLEGNIEQGPHPKMINGDPFREVSCNGEHITMLFGSPLSAFDHGKARFSEMDWVYEGRFWNAAEAHFNAETIKWVVDHFIHVPYLWGGRSIVGVDCSGFTQLVFRFFHQVLPRDAADQSQLGEPVGFIQEAKCGDLAFFDDEQGNIIHVGIMANSGEIWHASGSVRLDPIDHVGIMHKVSGERTHRLRIIKRIVPSSFVEFDV